MLFQKINLMFHPHAERLDNQLVVPFTIKLNAERLDIRLSVPFTIKLNLKGN